MMEINNNYFALNEDNLYVTVNLDKLVDTREKIIRKYRFHNELPYQMIERFTVQINEEYYEYKEELRIAIETIESKNLNVDDMNLFAVNENIGFELMDILLYLCSILSEYKENFLSENYEYSDNSVIYDVMNVYSEKNKEILLTENFYDVLKISLNEGEKEKRKFLLDDILLTLGEIRRKYPQRKYHKPLLKEKFTDSIKKDKEVNIISANLICNCIGSIIHTWLCLNRNNQSIEMTKNIIDKLNDVLSQNLKIDDEAYNKQ